MELLLITILPFKEVNVFFYYFKISPKFGDFSLGLFWSDFEIESHVAQADFDSLCSPGWP